jgi:hypothetical protein
MQIIKFLLAIAIIIIIYQLFINKNTNNFEGFEEEEKIEVDNDLNHSLNSYTRNGIAPMTCPENMNLESNIMCYHKPKENYTCKGTLCIENCPKGYKTDNWNSNYCILTKNTIQSFTDLCPWYDRCGLSALKGCSKCPPGYEVDGCLCHQVLDKFKRGRYEREDGIKPTKCPSGYNMDMGSCYLPCNNGYVGRGKTCYPIKSNENSEVIFIQ